MKSNVELVGTMAFGVLRPGDVFFHEGNYYLVLVPSDASVNAVSISGLLKTFDSKEKVYWCPSAHLSLFSEKRG